MATMAIRCKAHPGNAQGIGCKFCAEILTALAEGQQLRAEAIADNYPDADCVEILAGIEILAE